MRWHLEVPPERKKELEEWEKLNKRRAAKLLARPEVTPYLQGLMNTFMDLSRRRQFGMAELPLSVEAILMYGNTFGYNDDLRFFFVCMSGMDDEFLIVRSEDRKRDEDAKSKK